MATIKRSPISGRGLFTFKSFSAGTGVLYIERPLFAVLDAERLEDTCSECFKWTGDSVISQTGNEKGKSVAKCTGCKVVGYCTKKCQSKGWKRSHKHECAILKKMKDYSGQGKIPHAIRMLLQMLVLRAREQISNDDWLALLELEHHIDSRRSNEAAYADMKALANGTLKYSGTEDFFNLDFVEQLFARILTNSMTLVTQTFDPLGVLLDPMAARANHSCDPNAIIVMDGPEMTFRSLRPLKADEELTINYVDTSNPYDRRQFELQARYLFDCRCTKCEKGLTTNEDKWLLSADQLDDTWKAYAQQMLKDDPSLGISKGRSDSPVQNQNDKNVTVLENYAFHKKDEARYTDSLLEKIDRLENGLKLCHESKLYPLHRQPYPALRHDLIVSYLTTGKYDKISTAFIHALKRHFEIDPVLYPEKFHPVRVVHTWTLAKIVLYMSGAPEDMDATESPMTAMKLLEHHIDLGVVTYGLLHEVNDQVDKSHAPDSSFAKMVHAKYEEVIQDMARAELGLLQKMAGQVKPQWEVLREFAKVLEY